MFCIIVVVTIEMTISKNKQAIINEILEGN